MKPLLLFLALALIGLAPAGAQRADTSAPNWDQILHQIDDMGDFGNNDFSAEITVVSQKPGEADSTLVARYFRRDSQRQFTIVILRPEIQRGQGYFSSGDDVWFYDPESRKHAYSSLRDSFQGSDAQNSDFSSSTLHADYSVTEFSEERLGPNEVWVATLSANSRSVSVPKRKLWIRKDNLLVLKEEHYSVSDRLMRTIAIPRYQTVSQRFVPLNMLIVDNVRQGERTQISFASPSVSRLPDSVFSREYLERVNQ